MSVGGLAAPPRARVDAGSLGARDHRGRRRYRVHEASRKRDTLTTDGTNRQDVFSPTESQGISYLSPAITAEAAIHLRVTQTVAFSLGMLMWAEHASASSTTTQPPASVREVAATNQVPSPIATPAYHLATGPQVFLGPFLGMEFGP